MRTKIIYLPLTSKRNGRNHKSFLKENPKTISTFKRVSNTSREMNPISIPILSFPLNNTDNNDTNFLSFLLTSRKNYNPLSIKKHKILKIILPNSNIIKNKNKQSLNIQKKNISKSLFNKPVILSKTIKDKIKKFKESKKLKKINILDFGNNLKLYDDIEKQQKEKTILEKRERQLNEIYYDYDKSNQKQIMNSFSGNRADLLKNKVCFVKGIVDYLYPKLILQKMDFINKMKEQNYKKEDIMMKKALIGKYFITRHRNPEQNATLSKYVYGRDLDILRARDNFILSKKILINRCKVSKLTYDYDYV